MAALVVGRCGPGGLGRGDQCLETGVAWGAAAPMAGRYGDDARGQKLATSVVVERIRK